MNKCRVYNSLAGATLGRLIAISNDKTEGKKRGEKKKRKNNRRKVVRSHVFSMPE